MSNFDSIVANIKDDLEKYETAGLLNEDRMYQHAIQAVKRFGNDMAIIYDEIVEVNEGRAQLPPNFYSLLLAYKCEPLGYTTEVSKPELMTSIMFMERVRQSNVWSECNSCCEDRSDSIITENVYLDLGKKVSFHYHMPTLLRLTKNPMRKTMCVSTCKNLYAPLHSTPYEMRIEERELHTNFETGNIMLRYYGLPLDEDGNIDVPTSTNGALERYVESFIKRKVIEKLITNNDAQQGLVEIYRVTIQEEKVELRNAMNELKMRSLTPHALKKLARRNKLETLQYEVLTPTSW
jgi:hypothetical protein